MSYRYHLCAYDKNLIHAINKCCGIEDFNQLINKFFPNAEYTCDHMSDTAIFEIGGALPSADSIIKKYLNLNPLPNKWIDDDYEFVILGKEGLVDIIEAYRITVSEYYRELFANGNPNKQQLNEILFFLSERFERWDNPVVPDLKPYDLSDRPNIVSAWDYEYQIWDLVRIYKTFDWDNKVLVLTGW